MRARPGKSYLTGAPLLWAGFSSTVTVLSVWFREVSWSYAGMEGAEKIMENTDFKKRLNRKTKTTMFPGCPRASSF